MKGEVVVKEITGRGGNAKTYIEEIAKKVDAQNIINEVEDDFGPIDILINHAAVEPHIPLLEMDEWDWHRTLDVNLTGAFLMTQSVGRVMRAQGSGVIINLVSASTQAGKNGAAFVASMNGLEGLTRQAAQEFASHGIEVYSIHNIQENIVERVFALLDVQKEQR